MKVKELGCVVRRKLRTRWIVQRIQLPAQIRTPVARFG